MQHYKRFLGSIVLILSSVYCFISLLSYNVYQISSNSYSIAVKRSVNLGGEFGSFISMWMLQIFGYGYFLLILLCFVIGIILTITKKNYKFYSGLVLFYINSLIFLNLISYDSLYHQFSISGGGLIGEELLNSGERLLGEIGVILVILFCYLIVFLLLFDNSDLKKLYTALINYKNKLKTRVYSLLKIKSQGLKTKDEDMTANNDKLLADQPISNNLKGKFYNICASVKTKLKIKKKLNGFNKNKINNYGGDLKYSGEFELSGKNNKANNLWYTPDLKNHYNDEKKYGHSDDKKIEQSKDIDKTEGDDYPIKKYILKHEDSIDVEGDSITHSTDKNKNIESRIDERADETDPENDSSNNLPDTAISKEFEIPLPSILPIRVIDEKQKIDEIELTQNAKIIEKKLSDLGIKGRITGIEPGPIITMYEFEPESGVKVGKIQTVSEDLTMALKSKPVRITGVIQGKSAVGIEVPNRKRETVYFSELINSAEFKNSKSLLTIVLGKGPKGNNAVFDLAKCPHLLVAGSTGSGKSVFLNTLITSILFKATYEEVNFLMIDPKRLELTFYEGLPHLVTDVVCDPKKAAAALSWAVKEMEDRYKMMQEAKVRNIEQYNVYLKQNHKQILPFLVIIIDELSDLMLVSPKDVETSIMRLSQMARACGIHLVIATQRPSVNVITGVIKANMPSRLAFLVSSKIDSRTILDSNGAEELLGNGDMLFLPPGQGKLLRIHGAYISEEEIQNVINSIVNRHLPSQKKELLINEFEKSNNFDRITENTQDENLHEELLDLINERNMEYVSISFVQRNFRIGFNRAARLIERLQSEGILNNKGRIIK